MRGFQNGLIFKIWLSGSGDIWILVLQKKNMFFLDKTRGKFISEMAPKRRFLKGILQFSGNKHL